MMKTVFSFLSYIAFAFLFQLPAAQANWETTYLARQIQRQATELNSRTSTGDCERDTAQCLPLLNSLDKDSQQEGFFGLLNSRWKSCHASALKNSQFVDGKSLAAHLNSQSQTNIGDYNTNRLLSCLGKVSGDTRSTTAKYFYLMNRLQLGATDTLEQIAAIDNLLGAKQILQGIPCGSGTLPRASERCENLKASCRSDASSLKQMAADTADAEAQLAELDRLQREYQSGATDPGTLSLFKEKLDLISEARESIHRAYPWIKGESFKAARKKGSLEQAIRAQFAANREMLANRHSSLRTGALCLNGLQPAEAECKPENFKTITAGTPDFSQSIRTRNGIEDTRKSVAAHEWLQSAMCVEDYVNDRDATAEILETSSAQVGLTIASFGLAPIAMSARLPALARLGAAGGLTTTYTAFAAPHFQEAVKFCSKEKEALTNALNGSDGENGKSGGPGALCPSPNSPLAQATSNFDKCVSASLLLALDVATGVPGLAQVARITADNAKRIKQAETLLGRKLNAHERGLLIKAHETGKIQVVNGKEQYSEADIQAKARILQDGGRGFTTGKDGEIRKLMEARIVGRFTNNPVLDTNPGDEILFATKDGKIRYGQVEDVIGEKVYLRPEKKGLFGKFGSGVEQSSINLSQYVREGDLIEVTSNSGRRYIGTFSKVTKLPTGEDAIVLKHTRSGSEEYLRISHLDMSSFHAADVVRPGDYFQVQSKSGDMYFGKFSGNLTEDRALFIDGATGEKSVYNATHMRPDSYRRYTSRQEYERDLKEHLDRQEFDDKFFRKPEDNKAYEEARRRAEENARRQQEADIQARYRQMEEEANREAEALKRAQAEAEARAKAAREARERAEAAQREALERAAREARERAAQAQSGSLRVQTAADQKYQDVFQSSRAQVGELRDLVSRGGGYTANDYERAKALFRSLRSQYHPDKHPGLSPEFSNHANQVMQRLNQMEQQLRSIKGSRL